MERPNVKGRIFRWILMVIGGISFAVAMAFLFGLFVKLLWNWIMPEIFGLPEITYWQSWGLVLLSHILFKLGGKPGPTHHPLPPDVHWKNHFRRHFSPFGNAAKTDAQDVQHEPDQSPLKP
jgi:hypothetical protein